MLTILGNIRLDRENPDLLARPGTDMGDVPNAKWPMGLSSPRSCVGKNSGWARQQNTDELPIAKAMVGVDMRLSPNAYREMHWHSANEWSYILNGTVRVSAVNQEGESYVDDLTAGDLWSSLPEFLIRSKPVPLVSNSSLSSTKAHSPKMIRTS